MCFTVYIGTTEKQNVGSFVEGNTDIYLEEVSPEEEKVKAKFKSPFIYHVGSDTCCSCGLQFLSEHFNDPKWQDNRRAPQKFIEFINERTIKEDLEYYCCWFGDWSEPVEEKIEINIKEISLNKNYFGLRERQFILFKQQPG